LPVPVRDFAGVIMAVIDGLAVRSLVEPETDLAALYRALGFLLLSAMTASYAAAGLPIPPMDQFLELLGITPTDTVPEAPADISLVEPPAS
jgi:hypothetical protein